MSSNKRVNAILRVNKRGRYYYYGDENESLYRVKNLPYEYAVFFDNTFNSLHKTKESAEHYLKRKRSDDWRIVEVLNMEGTGYTGPDYSR